MHFSLQSLLRHHRVAFAIGLALCILGLRFLLIAKFSENIPCDDPLIKECDWVIAPLLEGKPWLDRFLLPHNEHRIYLSLGANVALTLLAGQWDGQAQAILSACLYASIMAGLFLWSWNHINGTARIVTTVGLIGLAVNVVAWEDVVWGFQAAFYFVIGLSLLAIHGGVCARPWSMRWWFSIACGAAALVSLGSGLLWTIPVILLATTATLSGSRDLRARFLPSGIAAVVIFAVGWRLAYFPPWHAGLRAGSLGEFVRYLVHCLAWPQPLYPILAVLWLAPSIALAARIVAHRRIEQREILVFAFFTWTSLQVLGLAYSRGAGAGYPASRYGDVLAMGLVAQLFMLGILWEQLSPRFPRFRLATVAWITCLVVALGLHTRTALHDDLPVYKARLAACAENIRTYLLTGDADKFLEGVLPLPSPLKDMVRPALDRPGMRAIMPASVRPPLALSFPDSESLKNNLPLKIRPDEANDPRGQWGTYSSRDAEPKRWISAICEPRGFGYWQMDVAGDIGEPGVELSLVSEISGRAVEPTVTHTPPVGQWKRIHLKVPHEPFRMVISPGGAGHWLGWTNPVEVSWLSYWTEYALRRAWWLIAAGLLSFLGGAVMLRGESVVGPSRQAETQPD